MGGLKADVRIVSYSSTLQSHNHESSAGLLMLELNVLATLAERGHWPRAFCFL